MSAKSETTWKIGNATITRIEELLGPAMRPAELLATWDPAVLEEHGDWLAKGFYQASTDQFIMSVHSWLIRTPHHTILIDTGCGNGKNRVESPFFHQLDTPYFDRLVQTGIRPEDVDYVVCTHLHVDHVGWNTRLEDGRWVPTFPNAKYVISREELNFWNPSQNPHLPEEPRQVFMDSVLPIVEAGQVQAVDMTEQLLDNLLIEPAPGHSPGQIMLRLLGDGEEAAFITDVMHNPIQVYQPTWNSNVCMDPEQAIKTRLRVLEESAERNALILPMHFGAPHAGRVRARNGGFLFEF
ncbi:MBL fold metallo-hydrolase [Mesorhizobium sp. 2RAF21]|uniref:MBL fold metallo-hydrolase n=1 Tax=Mesorhizobium sp. 2RAF21 TaxID=3232995 RepID=UPI003F9679E5